MINNRRLSVFRRVLACTLVTGVAAWSSVAAANVPSKQRVAQPSINQATPAQRAAARTVAAKRPVATQAEASQRPRVQAQAQTRQQPLVRQIASNAPAAVSLPVLAPHAETMGLDRVPDPLNLSASVAFVMDAETHEILVSKNDNIVLPIASITKLMTGILIADANLPMDEVITITDADVDRLKNSGSRLAVGTRLTRGQALHLAMMSSENRAAHALARTFPGGENRFVRLMNHKARDLGMTETRFADPTGLSPLNRSTARDVAVLTAASYERPILRELSTATDYALDVGGHTLPYRNSNRLVKHDAWDIALQKTGFIREAGRCLTMKFTVEGRSLIMVLLNSATANARLNDAELLRRWVQQANDGGSRQFARAN